MATEQVVEGLQRAFTAGADLTGKLNLIAKFDTSGNVVVAAGATDKMIGVIREEATSGNPATIQFGGVGKVISGGVIAAGDLLTSDGSGKAIATTSSGNRIIGIADKAAAGANVVISALLFPGSV